VIIKSRALKIASRLPSHLWPEIACATGYILNRTPKRGLGWITPIEKLQQLATPGVQDPVLKGSHLRAYGCRAYPLKYNIPRTQKFEPRAAIGYLVGYDSSNIFRIWIPETDRVIRTRDVIFDESIIYDPQRKEVPITQEISQTIEIIAIPHTEQEDEVETPPHTQFQQLGIHPPSGNTLEAQEDTPQEGTPHESLTPAETNLEALEAESTIIVDTTDQEVEKPTEQPQGIITPDLTPEPSFSPPSPEGLTLNLQNR